jgi:UTP--glucose-1-phosphate uridylyltransferase
MNSFNTDEDTQKVIRKYKGLQVEIYTFNQSCFPRINRESLLPVAKNCNTDANMEAWVTELKFHFHILKVSSVLPCYI